MANEREKLDNIEIGEVVGGFFHFDTNQNEMTYTHKDGTETKHEIVDAKQAWVMSNNLHGQLVPEDEILKQLVDNGYIKK